MNKITLKKHTETKYKRTRSEMCRLASTYRNITEDKETFVTMLRQRFRMRDCQITEPKKPAGYEEE